MVAMASERYLTVEECAERLRVDGATVRRWLRDGKLRGLSLGGRTGWRIPEEAFARFLDERMSG
jgi:excisionase family DNA binding protein